MKRLKDMENVLLNEKEMSENWKMNAILPLFKGKKDGKRCNSYESVKLSEHRMKVRGKFLKSG